MRRISVSSRIKPVSAHQRSGLCGALTFSPLVLRRSLEGVGSGKLLDLGDGKLRPAGRQQALAKHRFRES